jgi:hypothetical protein
MDDTKKEEPEDDLPEDEEGSQEELVLDKLTSLEQLDRSMVVVGIRAWILLAFFAFLISLLLAWSFFGTLPITVTGRCIIFDRHNSMELKAPKEGTVKKFVHLAGQKIKKGEPILIYENPDFELVAPADGEVLWINTQRGADANPKESVIGFQADGKIDQMSIVGFFSLASGQEVKVGMEALASIDKATPEKYGMIRAVVTEVYPYPVGPSEVALRKIPSPELTRYLRGNDIVPKLLVIAQPVLNPKNPSQFEWTSRSGPPHMVFPGSIGHVQVTLENVKPISYVLPKR